MYIHVQSLYTHTHTHCSCESLQMHLLLFTQNELVSFITNSSGLEELLPLVSLLLIFVNINLKYFKSVSNLYQLFVRI